MKDPSRFIKFDGLMQLLSQKMPDLLRTGWHKSLCTSLFFCALLSHSVLLSTRGGSSVRVRCFEQSSAPSSGKALKVEAHTQHGKSTLGRAIRVWCLRPSHLCENAQPLSCFCFTDAKGWYFCPSRSSKVKSFFSNTSLKCQWVAAINTKKVSSVRNQWSHCEIWNASGVWRSSVKSWWLF